MFGRRGPIRGFLWGGCLCTSRAIGQRPREVVVWMEQGFGKTRWHFSRYSRSWATCPVDVDDDSVRKRRLYRPPCPIQGLMAIHPSLPALLSRGAGGCHRGWASSLGYVRYSVSIHHNRSPSLRRMRPRAPHVWAHRRDDRHDEKGHCCDVAEPTVRSRDAQVFPDRQRIRRHGSRYHALNRS